jgi:aspartate aminotransferase
MKAYTIYVDGISKSLAATGVRVGWSMGPKPIIDKMKAILTHVGAWAPKAEQLATASFLNNLDEYDNFLIIQKEKVFARLQGLYNGLTALKNKGYSVDAISPQAAIYLKGKTTAGGTKLENTKDVTNYLLNEAKLAIVPFYAFGASQDSTWYRISVGTCKLSDVNDIISNVELALSKLS